MVSFYDVLPRLGATQDFTGACYWSQFTPQQAGHGHAVLPDPPRSQRFGFGHFKCTIPEGTINAQGLVHILWL